MRSIASDAAIAIWTLMITAAALPLRGATCESLAGTALPNTTITVTESVSSGHFAPPYGESINEMPAFCRVAGVIQPTADSYIRFEVWMPVSSWNGTFLAIGNGGFAGSIGYDSMGGNLKRGYATAGTDTGHEAEGVDASWAYEHPEKVIDFGYRALHETTENAKRLIKVFYGRPASHSYFDSCSDGGREALMEAQRFPEDFDGILAGAPANFWTHMLVSGIDVAKTMYGSPAAYISSVKIPAISAAVLAACDATDGVKDGIVSDPLECHFEPSVLLCKGIESRDCLTAPQVASLKKLYAGGHDSGGKLIFPGFTPGGEDGQNGWPGWILGDAPALSLGAGFVENYFRYMVAEDPAWTAMTANIDKAMRAADEKTARALNAIDPDLHRFRERGGKLILYHGWNDSAISPLNTVNYYSQIVTAMGARDTKSFVRLYMVPGMQHCEGGPGASSFGQLGTTTAKGPQHGIYAALEEWVAKGTAPGELVATKYATGGGPRRVLMTRPLCPYPQTADYRGVGDTNDSANFVCTDAKVATGTR
jgi:hypothetical protein